MKTSKFISTTLAIILLILSACKKSNEPTPEPPVEFAVTPEELIFDNDGGENTLTVESNNSWTAIADAEWCTLSMESGNKDATLIVKVQASTLDTVTTATITFNNKNGNTATVSIIRYGTKEIVDVCGNTYPVVKIGEQNWMAENMRCNKYAQGSEAYSASWLEDNTIPTSENAVFTPYYTDATNKANWDMYSTQHGSNLTSTQIKSLGYLYNWAAAVGLENGKNQTSEFTGDRQGICPDGWHIPTVNEWQTLKKYIEPKISIIVNMAGKLLKTKSGWYNNGNGSNGFAFSALPGGYSNGKNILNIGVTAAFWTATANESIDDVAYGRSISYNYNSLNDYELDFIKYYGQNVRCVQNKK
ncbi:MAG: hypothetical protein MJ010_01765 [Paludibacteraceae bacterium]|nr:hypothetical protein [Paludibacteraceae bacterium]